MEEKIQNDALDDRARRADKIIKNPKNYKICAGCESIVAKKVIICPNCHAYRYIDSESMIIAQAQQLGTREARSVLGEDLE
jgi:RNA polymerase subunit RPABC4/transcription elongation factor Spt4